MLAYNYLAAAAFLGAALVLAATAGFAFCVIAFAAWSFGASQIGIMMNTQNAHVLFKTSPSGPVAYVDILWVGPACRGAVSANS